MPRRGVVIIIKETPAKVPEAPKPPSLWTRINENFSLVLSLTGKVCVALATAALLYMAVSEAFSTDLAIDKIQIAPKLAAMGYDEQFFIATFVDSMNAIKSFAKTGGLRGGAGIRNMTDPQTEDVPHKRGDIKAEVMGTGLSFTQVLDVAMNLLSIEKRSINCEVICSGEKMTGYLHVYSLPPQRIVWKDGNDCEKAMGNIIRETALASLTFSDPATAALYLHGKGLNERAIAAARRLLIVNPNEKWVFNFVGRVFNEMAIATGDRRFYDSARLSLQKAITLDARFVSAYNNLGITFQNLGGPQAHDKALAMFRKAMAADEKKTYPYAPYNAARMYYRLQKPDSAIRCYKLSIAIDSTYVPALNNLAYVYRFRGLEDSVYYDSSLLILEKGFAVARTRRDVRQLWSTKAETLYYTEGVQAFYAALEEAVKLGYVIPKPDFDEEPYVKVKDEEKFKNIIAPKPKAKPTNGFPDPL